MTIHVAGPDGSIAQFPDGTPDATIQTAMAKTFGGPSPGAQAYMAEQNASNARMSAFRKAKSGGDDQALNPGINDFLNGASLGLWGQGKAALSAGITGAKNAVATLEGQKPAYGMGDAYTGQRLLDTREQAQFQKDHPVMAPVVGLAGGLMMPGAATVGKLVTGAADVSKASPVMKAILGSKGLLPTTVRSAAAGAVLGGAAGGMTATPGQTGNGALAGATTGAVLGTAAPAVAQGVSAAARAGVGAARAVGRGVSALLSPTDPLAAAAPQDTQYAIKQVLAQMRARGITPPQLAVIDALGKPITTAEAIGRPGVQTLGGLARRAGATPDALEGLLRDRADMAPTRMLGDFHEAAGINPLAAKGDIEGMVSGLQAKAKPLFDAALSPPGPVWNPDLAALSQRPVIKKAIGSVTSDLLNAGKDPTAYGITLDPDTGAPATGTNLAKVGEQQPTAEAWDMIRKAIGRQVERHPITGAPLPDSASEGNFGVRTATQDLTKALAGDPAHGIEGAIPGYRAALDKSGDYLQLKSAFDKGQSLLLDPKVDEGTFGQEFDGMDEPSQEAFKGGFANKLSDLAQNGRLSPKVLQSPRVQAKMNAAFGPDVTSALVAKAQMEARLAATGGRMMPGVGSPTMEYLNASAEQEGGPNAIAMLGKSMKDPAGTIAHLIELGKTAGTSPQVRNEMGRLYMQPPAQTAQELQGLFGAQPPAPGRVLPPPALMGLLGGYTAQSQQPGY